MVDNYYCYYEKSSLWILIFSSLFPLSILIYTDIKKLKKMERKRYLIGCNFFFILQCITILIINWQEE